VFLAAAPPLFFLWLRYFILGSEKFLIIVLVSSIEASSIIIISML
jgi:hypothetical protein